MRTRARGSATPSLPGRKLPVPLPGKSGIYAGPGQREGRAAVALALGLALLAAALTFLWRSTDERGPGRSRTEPAGQPTPAAKPAPELPETAVPGLAPTPEPRAREAEVRAAPAEMARLTLRVRAPAGEVPSSTEVEVRGEDGGTQRATLAATAPASLTLALGTYTLVATHAGPPVLASLPVGVALGAGEERSLELELVPCWRCTGFVSDDGTRGLAGLALTLERAGSPAHTTHTDALGRFAFPPLPEGEVTLAVGDPLGPLVPRIPVRLEAALSELEIRVPALLELTVRVLDPDGQPVSGARVEGVGERGGRVEGTTDADGELRAHALPPGNYRLFASHATLGRGNRIFVLAPGDDAALEIRLLTERPPR